MWLQLCYRACRILIAEVADFAVEKYPHGLGTSEFAIAKLPPGPVSASRALLQVLAQISGRKSPLPGSAAGRDARMFRQPRVAKRPR